MSNSVIVTISIALYNTGGFVIKGLDSVIKQTFLTNNFEIIVVDDASEDDSVSLIKKWINNHPDINIKLIQHAYNKGLSATLNTGLFLATGNYFAPLADDLWKPDRLEKLVTALEESINTVAFIHSSFDICDENEFVYKTDMQTKKYRPTEDEYINLLTNGLSIHAVTTLYKTNTLLEIGGFDERLSFEDFDIYLKLCIKGYSWIKHPDSLVIYRKSANVPSLSSNHIKDYSISKDFILMNGNHYGLSSFHDKLNFAALNDALNVYTISSYNKHFRNFQTKYNTIWTPFVLKLLREKKWFFSYFRFVFFLTFKKKFSPYSFKDNLYFIKIYFKPKIKFF